MWNSLEIVKLAIGALTPILVVVVGFFVSHRLKSLEEAQWARQKIVERRIAAYDQIAPQLNQLFCFFTYVGSWKELEPPQVVGLKRELDQAAHISAPLFDGDFLPVYNRLIEHCFATFGGWGQDAKLRTLTTHRRSAFGPDWKPSWDSCFAGVDATSEPAIVKKAYDDVMAYLGQAMGATQVNEHLS